MSDKLDSRAADPSVIRFANAYGILAGAIASLLAVAGIWLGFTGDTILKDATPELWTAVFITVGAVAVLVMPWKSRFARPLGLLAAAAAYHLTLDFWWVPWMQNYGSLAAIGADHRVWDEALALPLLNAAGVLLIIAAMFSWPIGRARGSMR